MIQLTSKERPARLLIFGCGTRGMEREKEREGGEKKRSFDLQLKTHTLAASFGSNGLLLPGTIAERR